MPHSQSQSIGQTITPHETKAEPTLFGVELSGPLVAGLLCTAIIVLASIAKWLL